MLIGTEAEVLINSILTLEEVREILLLKDKTIDILLSNGEYLVSGKGENYIFNKLIWMS